MRQKPLQSAADRVGWFAYLTVMGGGVPFWPVLFANRDIGGPAEDDGVLVGPDHPFAGTVPYTLRPEHEAEAERLATA